jgi:hypothetical protein
MYKNQNLTTGELNWKYTQRQFCKKYDQEKINQVTKN